MPDREADGRRSRSREAIERRPRRRAFPAAYSLLAIVVNVLLRLVPTRLNAAIAATAINAAINAYSIAVTPDSSLTKLMRVRNRILLGL